MAEMKVLSHEAESLAGDLRVRVSRARRKSTLGWRARFSVRCNKSGPNRERQIDLTVATYALFGMMNWIYNWYNPRGKLAVTDLVDNVTRLYLTGFLNATQDRTLEWPSSTRSEGLSVWREPGDSSTNA